MTRLVSEQLKNKRQHDLVEFKPATVQQLVGVGRFLETSKNRPINDHRSKKSYLVWIIADAGYDGESNHAFAREEMSL